MLPICNFVAGADDTALLSPFAIDHSSRSIDHGDVPDLQRLERSGVDGLVDRSSRDADEIRRLRDADTGGSIRPIPRAAVATASRSCGPGVVKRSRS